jgi:hypothetical protein
MAVGDVLRFACVDCGQVFERAQEEVAGHDPATRQAFGDRCLGCWEAWEAARAAGRDPDREREWAEFLAEVERAKEGA